MWSRVGSTGNSNSKLAYDEFGRESSTYVYSSSFVGSAATRASRRTTPCSLSIFSTTSKMYSRSCISLAYLGEPETLREVSRA
ncbi:unnamed protein product [Cochlearia groenlandica]